MSMSVRAPRREELARMQDIERAAGQMFAEVGLPEIAAHEPVSIEALAGYIDAGRAWVVCEDDAVVGYAVVDVVDGVAHLEQMSVHPDRGRRGLGSALLEHVIAELCSQGQSAITLTTFSHVAWNAPFYARHGFRVLDEAELGPELWKVRAREARHGLDPDLRVCMRRELGHRSA